MSNRISRRDMLKNVGVAGAAGALLASPGVPLLAAGAQGASPDPRPDQSLEQSSLELLKQHEDYSTVLEAGEMVVRFDRRYGSISSITRKNDPLETNYIGNETNTPGVDPSDSRWTGDVVRRFGTLPPMTGSMPALAKMTYFECPANGEES